MMMARPGRRHCPSDDRAETASHQGRPHINVDDESRDGRQRGHDVNRAQRLLLYYRSPETIPESGPSCTGAIQQSYLV